MKLQVMTANRLSDGAVVYLDGEGRWTERLAEAQVTLDPETQSALERRAEAAVRGQEVVGAYLFQVDSSSGTPEPIGQREIIRAGGPSAGTDLTPSSLRI